MTGAVMEWEIEGDRELVGEIESVREEEVVTEVEGVALGDFDIDVQEDEERDAVGQFLVDEDREGETEGV